VVDSSPLTGGCIAEVLRVSLDDGACLVAKLADAGGLEPEAWMLRYLAAHSELPVPAVVHDDDRLLVIEWVENDGGSIDAGAERHAAELLAALHGVSSHAYGLERATVVGGLPQPNPWTPRWLDFFRDHRLLYMGRRALDSGSLPARTFVRLEALCGRLDRWIEEPVRPALIHGDVWGGNVLVADGRIAAFVDPAIYYADPEMELAFSTLFSTFGDAFFARYRELAGLRGGFFEERRDLYNLYPLLVHTVLFGGGYARSVEHTLRRFVG
jgi:fructosamine-3-kinase